MSKTEIIDNFLKRWMSRKLFTVVLATALLIFKYITPVEWSVVVGIYLVGQTYLDKTKN